MTESMFRILSNRALNASISEMILEGDVSALTRPGQFVNIKIDGLYLRRPISVADYSDGRMTLIYRAVGEGTRRMRDMREGESLNILVGLGNGYETAVSGDAPLLAGGGVGVPPLYGLAKKLCAEGKRVRVLLGFRSADDVFYEEEFRALGASVTVVTEDGSRGVKGFVTAAMDGDYTYVYACGPEPMLKAVSGKSETSGQFSFEERMGCGFGACMGCSCKTKYGNKRICRDGPVLTKEEIIWD